MNTDTKKLAADSTPAFQTPIFDYAVRDRSGDKIGTVNDLWPNAQNSGYSFIGVHTGWFIGRNHVVPADGMIVDHEEEEVTLPLSAEAIKAAPDFKVSDEIVTEDSERIRGHYGIADSTKTKDKDVVDVAIREEKVKVGKREVEAGSVRLRRVVRTETVNVPVELRSEDVVIERIEADGMSDTGEKIGEKQIVIPISREEPVVQKTTEVTGVVRARKTVDKSTEQVNETVRKEDVEIDRNVSRDGKKK